MTCQSEAAESVLPWNKILDQSAAQGHLVQFYGGNEESLVRNVARYIGEGLKGTEGLILVATAAHTEKMLQRMEASGANPDQAVQRGQLVVLDAHATLARFMLHGQPDWDRFESAIGPVIRDLRWTRRTGLRAFGEMVGILWQAGQMAAAVRLEHFWNRMLNRCQINLFCAYPIDVFSAEFHAAGMDALLCTHTHVVPGSRVLTVESAMRAAMIEVLGPRADGIEADYRKSWAVMPRGEAMILWMRRNLPGGSDEIFARAREIYTASHFPQ